MHWLVHIVLLATTLIGAALATAIQAPRLRDDILACYPRSSRGLAAVNVLEKSDQQLLVNGVPRDVGVLRIEDRGWDVIFDFVQSEIATPKSSRDEATLTRDRSPTPASGEQKRGTPSPTFGPEKATPVSGSGGIRQETPRERLAPVDCDRVKTITNLHLYPMRAGRIPLTPEYALLVWSPPDFGRNVYEFLSFDEFRTDLRAMLVSELSLYSGGLGALALIAEIVIVLIARTRSRQRETTVGS